MSNYAYENVHNIPKRFRHNEEYIFRPHKRYWTKFVIDKQERTILGNRPRQWGGIVIFYICFYIVLTILFVICWLAFINTLPMDVPRWMRDQPGVGYAPVVTSKGILYDVNSNEGIAEYTDKINEYLQKYGDGTELFGGENGCSPINDYGFAKRTPCIFLKMNRIYGFKPDPYLSASELPDSAPADLKAAMMDNAAEAAKGRIWVSCKSDLEKEATYTYFPAIRSIDVALIENVQRRSFDLKDYGRVIAVMISDFPLGREIQFKCYYWAKNIKQDEEMLLSKDVGQFTEKIISLFFNKVWWIFNY